jgi:catechol 2,3-dioxygenase-like lactoylglutathione lyase family enzyme
MPRRCLHHVELSVLDYDKSIEFYDRMFGFLGYTSFWTLNIGYRSTYYTPSFFPIQSYIGIQPAKEGDKLLPGAKATGVHHVAIWAKDRREIDDFHKDFLVKNNVKVTEPPAYYLYAPGYYAVFFDDPITGIHWELAYIPSIPSPLSYIRWKKAFQAEAKKQDENVGSDAFSQAVRKLPGR